MILKAVFTLPLLFCADQFFRVINCNVQEVKLSAIIENINSDKGSIRLALYNSSKTFLKEKFRTETVDAKKGSVKILIDNIPNGEYAIAVIHDEDNNGKFNANWIGMPTEGFGFSNDARGLMGAPSFAKAKFIIESNFAEGKEVVIKISLKYF